VDEAALRGERRLMDRPDFSIRRDRLSFRLAELARKLEKPTLENIEKVRLKLERLAKG
jgi:hypothetical protein